MKIKVVLHIDCDDEDPLIMALNNIENLLKEVPAKKALIYLVANGTAVRLFQRDRDSGHASRIQCLAETGVNFFVCHNSLNNLGIKREELLEPCHVVSAGIMEIIRLQSQGCAYVKP